MSWSHYRNEARKVWSRLFGGNGAVELKGCVKPSVRTTLSNVVARPQLRPKGKKPSTLGLQPPPCASEFPPYSPVPFFRYELIHNSTKSRARVGRIHTPHGVIDTPSFVAVATNGALKCVSFDQADDAGQQLVFANSYHLMIHPGLFP